MVQKNSVSDSDCENDRTEEAGEYTAFTDRHPAGRDGTGGAIKEVSSRRGRAEEGAAFTSVPSHGSGRGGHPGDSRVSSPQPACEHPGKPGIGKQKRLYLPETRFRATQKAVLGGHFRVCGVRRPVGPCTTASDDEEEGREARG